MDYYAPDRTEGGSKHCFCPFVCLSDTYLVNNWRTQRPSVPKLVMKVSHLTCDSHTSFKVKQSKVRVTDRQGHTVSDKPGSHTPCCMCLTCSSITSLWTVNKVPFVQETANNFYTVSLLTTLTQKGFNCIITASNKYSGPRMANVTNPHCHQYVDCWPNCQPNTLWLLTVMAANTTALLGKSDHCPTSTCYCWRQTNEQTNEQTNRRQLHRVKFLLCGRGLKSSIK